MKIKPRVQDIAFLSVASLAVFACLYFSLPTWMLIFSAAILVIVFIGMMGNMGVFERRH